MRTPSVFASLLVLMLATSLQADATTPAPIGSIAASNAVDPAEEIKPTQRWVVSPWGFGGWYWVYPGLNLLHCTGTGNLFEYYA